VQQAPYHAPSEGPEELKLPITKEMDSAIPARTAEICRDNWPCYDYMRLFTCLIVKCFRPLM
jgi:hypothetical protein